MWIVSGLLLGSPLIVLGGLEAGWLWRLGTDLSLSGVKQTSIGLKSEFALFADLWETGVKNCLAYAWVDFILVVNRLLIVFRAMSWSIFLLSPIACVNFGSNFLLRILTLFAPSDDAVSGIILGIKSPVFIAVWSRFESSYF